MELQATCSWLAQAQIGQRASARMKVPAGSNKEGLKKLFRLAYKGTPFKRRFFTLLRCCFVPPKSVYEHLYFTGEFVTRGNGVRIKMVNYDSPLETAVFWGGLYGYEPWSMKLWVALCRGSATILDIGSNTGLFALSAKAVSPPLSRIYSFEPIERFDDKLRTNSKLNGFSIEHRSFALSNEDGDAVIYDLPFEHHYHASLAKTEVEHLSPNLLERKIRAKRLSTFIEEETIGKVDLMKIDVEGCEVEVLEGMGAYLFEMLPSMVVEIKSDEEGSRIESLLRGTGYLYFDIDEKQGPKKASRIAKSSTLNYLICTQSAAEKLTFLT